MDPALIASLGAGTVSIHHGVFERRADVALCLNL
jgi:hypothetical protein